MSEQGDQHAAPDPLSARQGYDVNEPKMALVAASGGAIMVLLILVILAVQFYFDRVEQQLVFVRVAEPVAQDLKDLRHREDSELHSYEYIDRAKGVVRVPIERAMTLLAREYADGKVAYPTKPTPVKSAADLAAPPATPAAAGAPPAAAPQGVANAPAGAPGPKK